MKTFIDLVHDIKQKFSGEGTGHDWYHIERVLNTSLHIQSIEGGDKDVISYAALLHDIDDHKFNGGDFDKGAEVSKNILSDYPLSSEQKNKVIGIVRTISFKGSGEIDRMETLEGKIVQDADRIDAIGAIGIARTFAYGGSIKQPIYDPKVSASKKQSKKEYIEERTHTINHFYEKLLLLEERMKTSTGKKIAKDRTNYMKAFLDQFYNEWNAFK